jgi:hypothetical protein
MAFMIVVIPNRLQPVRDLLFEFLSSMLGRESSPKDETN